MPATNSLESAAPRFQNVAHEQLGHGVDHCGRDFVVGLDQLDVNSRLARPAHRRDASSTMLRVMDDALLRLQL
jgi:hypothetical protein